MNLSTVTVEAIARLQLLNADLKRVEFRKLLLGRIEASYSTQQIDEANKGLAGGLSKALEACHWGVHAAFLNQLDMAPHDRARELLMQQFVSAYNDPELCIENPRAANGKAIGWYKHWIRYDLDPSKNAQAIIDAILARHHQEETNVEFDVNKASETFLHILSAVHMDREGTQSAELDLVEFTNLANEVRKDTLFLKWRKEVQWDDQRMEGIMAACNLTLSSGISEHITWANAINRCETVGFAACVNNSDENQEESTVQETTATTIPDQMATAINTLASTSIPGFDVNAFIVERATLNETIEKLKKAASTPKMQVASTGESTVDGDTLTYEVVNKKASDIFRNPASGRSLKSLDFDLPTLEWTDPDGNVVTHPMQPEIDDNYQFRAKHVLKLATAFLMNRNLWAHGHTGTGKTTLIEQFYARLGFPVYRVNLDSNLERADLTGTMTLENHDGVTVTKWTDGVLPQAMQQPCALVLDEIDAGRPDILFTIQRALESKGLLLTEDAGRLVKPHELFRFAATANSKGQGDEYGIYAGVRPMNMAMLDRFPVFLEVDYLQETEEDGLLKRTFPNLSETVRNQMCSYAKLIREAFKNGEISLTLSPRGLLAMGEFYTFYEGVMPTAKKALDTAVEMTTIDKAADDNVQRVRELANRAFG